MTATTCSGCSENPANYDARNPVTPTIPTYHLGGSSPKVALEDLFGASQAVQLAIQSLRSTAPNARDYIDRPGDLRRAEEEHGARLERLGAVLEELAELSEAAASAIR